MSPKAGDQSGMARGHRVQDIADMNAGDGTRRAFEFTAIAIGEGDGGAVQPVLEAGGEDADDAFVYRSMQGA